MSESENSADSALRAQLGLFCALMLGSADAADRVLQQIYSQASDSPDESSSSMRVRLFRIAAEICGIRPLSCADTPPHSSATRAHRQSRP